MIFICDERIYDNIKFFVKQKENGTVKNAVCQYLNDSNYQTSVLACAETDLLTGKEIDNASSVMCYSDGEFEWTSEITYLFEHYDLKLNNKFIEKIKTLS